MPTPKAFPIVEQVAQTGETLDKVDTVVVTVGGVAVIRQVSVIGDPVNGDAYGAVINTEPAGTEYAPVVRALLPSAPIPVGGTVSVSNFPAPPATQPVSATALPLPAGASTEATLAALAGKIGVPASDDVLTLLRSIVTNTGLEVTRADTLELTADQINLNTDSVEAKLDTVSARLGQIGTAGTLADLLSLVLGKLIAAPATEATLATRTKPSDQQHVIVDSSAAVPVTGAFYPTTQPVSGSIALAAGSAAIGAVSVSNFPAPPATQAVSGSVAVSNLPATQAVSATALPLPTGAAQDGADITTPTAMPAGGVGIRGWLSAIWTKLNGSLAVTGAFYQATQPVSGTIALGAGVAAIGAVSVSNLPATQPVSGSVAVSNLPATQPVSGTVALAAGAAAIGAVSVSNLPATQAVSLATNTPDVTDRAARLLGHVTVDATPKGTRTNSAVAPTTAATLLLAANTSRKGALLVNNGTATVYLGSVSTITTATGIPLAAGASISDDSSTGAWYGIMATGAGDVRVVEVA